MPADGHTHKGGISARPAGCTDETLHQFALLKKRARMTANVQVRRDCETIGALLRPATEKRQGAGLSGFLTLSQSLDGPDR
jgi:hypothetical protein